MKYIYRIATLSSLLIILFMNGCSQKDNIAATAHTSAARHKVTMRTYHVRGRTYHPTFVSIGDTMRGISSWYGPNFHGKYTSNGEIYNMHKMTAAHKTWPMDTIVRVQNIDNGSSVVVRINDRGPFVRGRIIDCSYAAGKKLGLNRTGIAHVKLTVLGFAGKEYKPDVADKPKSIKPAPRKASKPTPKPITKVRLRNFGVQAGAFGRQAGAEALKKKYEAKIDKYQHVVIRKSEVEGEVVYRVLVMGFESADEANDFIHDNQISGGQVIRP